jgi:hypothetical protein
MVTQNGIILSDKNFRTFSAPLIEYRIERQCTLMQQWGAFEQLLWWKRNTRYIFWVCVCSLWYPAYNEHKPYCHLWPVRLYNIFFMLSHIRHNFRNNIIIFNTCFDSLYNICLEISYSKKNCIIIIIIIIIISVHGVLCKVPLLV